MQHLDCAQPASMAEKAHTESTWVRNSTDREHRKLPAQVLSPLNSFPVSLETNFRHTGQLCEELPWIQGSRPGHRRKVLPLLRPRRPADGFAGQMQNVDDKPTHVNKPRGSDKICRSTFVSSTASLSAQTLTLHPTPQTPTTP